MSVQESMAWLAKCPPSRIQSEWLAYTAGNYLAQQEYEGVVEVRTPRRLPATIAVKSKLLPPGEVAKRLGVDDRTVRRWADSGKLPCVTTAGGHRRYREIEVNALALGTKQPRTW